MEMCRYEGPATGCLVAEEESNQPARSSDLAKLSVTNLQGY